MKRTFLIVAGLTAAALSAKDKEPKWETAKVVYQNISSARSGAYAAPVGTGAVAITIYRNTNAVSVETATTRLDWIESGRSGFVILPVNGTVQFYRDGDRFVVLDIKKKKHKFVLVGMRALSPAVPKP